MARLSELGALLLVAGLSSGCFHYVAVQPAAVRSGEEVQVRISPAAATRIVPEFGTFTGHLEGHLAEGSADSLALSILISRDYRGMSLDHVRQTLFFGRAEVLEVRRRQLSRVRTAVATAGLLAGFAVLIRSVVQEGDPNPGDENPPPPPPDSYRGLLRIRMP